LTLRRFANPAGQVVGVAVVLAIAVALTLLVFRLPVLESARLIIDGAFGDRFGVARTLVRTCPLLLTSIGMLVAWRAGMYNIGGEGQYVLGGLGAAALFKLIPGFTPGPGLLLCLLLSSMLAGSLWALLSGWLYTARGVDVVISTILLNFVALQLLSWLVVGPLQETKRQLPLSDRLPDTGMFLRFDRQSDLHTGIMVALLAMVVVWLLLSLTPFGFKLRLVGANPRAARSNRINVSRTQLGAMMLSGALCGLAGGVEYSGVSGQIGSGFAQNWGFLAIPVALLGGLHPLGVSLSSLVFGALFAGSENLSRFASGGTIGTSLIFVIQAVAVLGYIAIRAVQEQQNRQLAESEAD
jgi:simple sugar transport system permease protein